MFVCSYFYFFIFFIPFIPFSISALIFSLHPTVVAGGADNSPPPHYCSFLVFFCRETTSAFSSLVGLRRFGVCLALACVCCVACSYHVQNGAMTVRAMFALEPGTELLVSYLPVHEAIGPTPNRQDMLSLNK